MNSAIKKGFSFGLTSGIITTLGLMVGLESGTHSRMVVIGGILTIAIADALSDALGMHISQEAETDNTAKEIWASTISTAVTKFIFSLSFLLPVIFFDLSTAIWVAIAYGLILLCLLSYYISLKEKIRPWEVIGEHLIIAILVIVATRVAGGWIESIFK